MSILTGAYTNLQELIDLAATSHRVQTPRKSSSTTAGERVSKHRGRGVDFEEVRLYQPGDDVRNIDWNVTARKQVPHTKVFTEERERPTLVVVDQTSTMFFGSTVRLKSVASAEIAARICWRTLAVRDRVGGIVLGISGIEIIKPFRNGATVVKVLRAIVEANSNLSISRNRDFTVQSRVDLWNSLLIQLRRIAPAHHRIVVVSDFATLSENSLQELLARGRHNELQVVHVFDDLERELPPANTYTVTDGENQVSFNTGRRPVREEYENRFENRVTHLRHMCFQNNVAFTSISTSEELDSYSFDA